VRVSIDGADIVGNILRAEVGRGCASVYVLSSEYTGKKKYGNDEACHQGFKSPLLPVTVAPQRLGCDHEIYRSFACRAHASFDVYARPNCVCNFPATGTFVLRTMCHTSCWALFTVPVIVSACISSPGPLQDSLVKQYLGATMAEKVFIR